MRAKGRIVSPLATQEKNAIVLVLVVRTRGASLPEVRPIFQPLEQGELHALELRALIEAPWAETLTLSSAYVNSAGVAAIESALRSSAAECRAFIGVRNGSTTAQGLAAILSAGVRLYGVDTAMRARIFHPKLYMARGQDRADVLIGSANITHPGLFNNIEAGVVMSLDLEVDDDRGIIDHFEAGLQKLIDECPEHCFEITTGKQIVKLIREGIVEDERHPTDSVAAGAGGGTTVKTRIDLPFVPPPPGKKRHSKTTKSIAGVVASSMPHAGPLLWAKPNLPAGDLQLLTVGHGSGVLRLTQARFRVDGKVIDQTTYFRTVAFGGLPWAADPDDPQKEMTTVPVSLVVAGVYVGDFDLRVSHKPAWEAGQGNYTTGLHWDGATEHIRKQGLVGRTLRIYAPALTSNRHVLEID